MENWPTTDDRDALSEQIGLDAVGFVPGTNGFLVIYHPHRGERKPSLETFRGFPVTYREVGKAVAQPL